MFDDLIKYEKFGTTAEIEYLLFRILSPLEFKILDDVKKLCSSYSYSFPRSFSGTIALLTLLGFIEVDKEKVKASNTIVKYGFFKAGIFHKALFIHMQKENLLNDFFSLETTYQNFQTSQFYIKDSAISVRLIFIKKILINTNFLLVDNKNSNRYLINPIFTQLFLEIIIPTLQTPQKSRRFSLHNFLLGEEVKREYGKVAEDYVLKFELNRLANHPRKMFVQIISDDYVNAGYDIESYNESDSLVLDRMIEVKSFNEKLEFYWSKNEIETARKLGELYFLYLVDRSKIENTDYAPSIIRNPYKHIFLENGLWQRTAENYLFSHAQSDVELNFLSNPHKQTPTNPQVSHQ